MQKIEEIVITDTAFDDDAVLRRFRAKHMHFPRGLRELVDLYHKATKHGFGIIDIESMAIDNGASIDGGMDELARMSPDSICEACGWHHVINSGVSDGGEWDFFAFIDVEQNRMGVCGSQSSGDAKYVFGYWINPDWFVSSLTYGTIASQDIRPGSYVYLNSALREVESISVLNPKSEGLVTIRLYDRHLFVPFGLQISYAH